MELGNNVNFQGNLKEEMSSYHFQVLILLSVENRVRPLVLVIKKWASHHDINDASRGTLSSYSLVLMVLHYLQSKYYGFFF